MNTCSYGDAGNVLPLMVDAGVKVQVCVTSPPYFNLRDYGHDDQIGNEKTIDQYIEKLCSVFSSVHKLLKDDGTLWINIGDSYIDKDLQGIPWQLVFALKELGFILRSSIIWKKNNVVPESVKDRPTCCYENIFLFAKSKQYKYNADAVAEDLKDERLVKRLSNKGIPPEYNSKYKKDEKDARRKFKDLNRNTYAAAGTNIEGHKGYHDPKGNVFSYITSRKRNLRNVWSINTSPNHNIHFATFPPALAERCILAGSDVGDAILDPFLGSGTVAYAAEKLGRQWVGVELNEEYKSMIDGRTKQKCMMI